MRLQIIHTTAYHYSYGVKFGPHRLMVRPRESHDLTVETSRLEIFPAHNLRWRNDIYGNSVGIVDFLSPANELRIISEVMVKHLETNPFNFILENYALNFPFAYETAEAPDVAPYLTRLYPSETEAIKKWLKPYWQPGQVLPTMNLLTNINQGIQQSFRYLRREETGVQSPAETIDRLTGSCRDFATLMMEACRVLGLGARFVSGYLHQSDSTGEDHGSTHAWVDVYLPGAGWKGFDPTSGLLACDLHVPVAVSRYPEGACPVSGSFSGTPADCLNMIVSVQVRQHE